ncbi:MAG: flavodoxin family protein [Ruminococcus sp.]|nr:flavodoxin family protein [Ruminococcus sp.]
MKIVILMGSPNPNGSTSILAENFKRGAEESGHTVEQINVCRLNVDPCTGCVACGYEANCVQNDGSVFFCKRRDRKGRQNLAETAGADLYEISPAVSYTSADLNWQDKRSKSSIVIIAIPMTRSPMAHL